jgi:hypothetical protein
MSRRTLGGAPELVMSEDLRRLASEVKAASFVSTKVHERVRHCFDRAKIGQKLSSIYADAWAPAVSRHS